MLDEGTDRLVGAGPYERVIVNLASVEYAKAVEPYAKTAAAQGEIRYVTCLFGSMRSG